MGAALRWSPDRRCRAEFLLVDVNDRVKRDEVGAKVEAMEI